MKKTAIILGILALAACGKVEYTTAPFVIYQQTTYNVNEDCGTVEIPVTAYNITGETTISFNFGGTAVSGTDYTLADGQTGTLTFTESNPTQTIKLNVIWGPDKTGTRTVEVAAKSATSGVDVPSKPCKVNIADVVFVDWAYVAKTWKSLDYDYPGGAAQGSAYQVEIKQVDDSKCTISNLWGAGETLNGTVEFAADHKSATLKIVAGQLIYNSGSYGPCIMTWSDGSSLYGSSKTFECPIDGSGIKIGGPTLGFCYYVYITSGSYAGYGFGMTYSELSE